MGDAILCGYVVWSRYDAVLIVVGCDQVVVSAYTAFRRAIARFPEPSFRRRPVTRMGVLNVRYVLD